MRDNSVSRVTGYKIGLPGFNFRQIFLSSLSQPALESFQSIQQIPRAKRLGREAHHSPSCSANVHNYYSTYSNKDFVVCATITLLCCCMYYYCMYCMDIMLYKGLCILQDVHINCHMFTVTRIVCIVLWHLPRGGQSP
jgi:hypothetical protein